MAAWEEGKRTWQPRELSMASEFIAEYFPGIPSLTRVHLGVPAPATQFEGLTPEEISLRRVYNRWADAIVLAPDRVIIVECKIRPRLGPLEGLELYGRLFKTDPQFATYRNRPIEKWFVYAVEDPILNMFARERGIKTVNYVPKWLPEYLRILQRRETRAPLTEI